MAEAPNLSAGEVLPALPAESTEGQGVVVQAQGLLGEVIQLEQSAAEIMDGAKKQVEPLLARAQELREQMKAMLKRLDTKTIKHNSGYSVTVAEEKVFKFPSEDIIMAGLTKLNWLPLYTEVIPEHTEPAKTEIKTKELIAALKKNPAAVPYFEGVQIENTETLKITKPKK